MDYDATFTQRARAYTYAVKTYPATLKEEFSTAVKMCQPFSQGDRLVNIPAACIDIDAFLPPGVEHIPIETNAEFARLNGVPVGKFDAIPLEDGAATHILCLASLHHATVAERQEFYAEAWRVLRPGGRLVIGDVAEGTRQAAWLNEFVDAHNSLGHKGLFWKEGDTGLIAAAGFETTTCLRSYEWRSAGPEAEIDFVSHLFGLDRATDEEIVAGLNQYFPGRVVGAELPWALRYFIAVKPT
jgi:SAM-dependent methyltransferase